MHSTGSLRRLPRPSARARPPPRAPGAQLRRAVPLLVLKLNLRFSPAVSLPCAQDELHWFAEALGLDDYFCEINVLPPGDPSCPSGMWTTRVTSHIALADVPELVTAQRIKDACRLAHR